MSLKKYKEVDVLYSMLAQLTAKRRAELGATSVYHELVELLEEDTNGRVYFPEDVTVSVTQSQVRGLIRATEEVEAFYHEGPYGHLLFSLKKLLLRSPWRNIDEP